MKNRTIIILCIVDLILVILLGIYLLTRENGTSDKKMSENSKISSFKFSYGSDNQGYYEYEIYKEGEEYIFTAKGYNGVELEERRIVKYKVLEDVQKIIEKHNIEKWNNFNKVNQYADSAYIFSLLVGYSDNSKIEAKGYHEFPSNYKNFEKEIEEYLRGVYNDGQKIDSSENTYIGIVYRDLNNDGGLERISLVNNILTINEDEIVMGNGTNLTQLGLLDDIVYSEFYIVDINNICYIILRKSTGFVSPPIMSYMWYNYQGEKINFVGEMSIIGNTENIFYKDGIVKITYFPFESPEEYLLTKEYKLEKNTLEILN